MSEDFTEEQKGYFNGYANSDQRYTCPACLTDHLDVVSKCKHCSAPLKCVEETTIEHVCYIPTEDEEGVDE